MSNFFESKNPVLKDKYFVEPVTGNDYMESRSTASFIIRDDTMSVQGAINKTFILMAILMSTTLVSYAMPSTLLLWTGIIGGLIAVLVATFKPHTSAVSAPVYAMFEGLFIGSISAAYAAQFQGIVFQAVGLTFGTLLTMLIIYKLEIVKVTEKFKAGVIMATGGVLLAYLVSWIMSLMGFQTAMFHNNGIIGIGISVVILVIASLNLLLDFDAFEKGAEHQAPKYMEWFCAMGLMITLVWLYIEFLRLLSKLNRD